MRPKRMTGLRRERSNLRRRWVLLLATFPPALVVLSFSKKTYLADYPIFDSNANHNLSWIAKNEIIPKPEVVKSTPNDQLANRTLVIVLGDLRCGNPAWDSLYKNVLDYNQADLALFTQPPPQHEYSNASMLNRAVHVEMIPSYVDWADAIDLVDGPAWRERVARYYNPTSHPSLLGGVQGYVASGAIVNMYKWFAAQRILERGWLSQYDRFVVTRTDQFYDYPLEIEAMDSQYMWIPEGEDYGGITDRFFIASSPFVVTALDTISPFLKHPEHYRWPFRDARAYHGPFKVNCEKYLWHVWKKVGLTSQIRRFKRGFFTCMAPIDNSRWGVLGEKVAEGVYLKYPAEYTETKRKRPRFALKKKLLKLYEHIFWFGF